MYCKRTEAFYVLFGPEDEWSFMCCLHAMKICTVCSAHRSVNVNLTFQFLMICRDGRPIVSLDIQMYSTGTEVF